MSVVCWFGVHGRTFIGLLTKIKNKEIKRQKEKQGKEALLPGWIDDASSSTGRVLDDNILHTIP